MVSIIYVVATGWCYTTQCDIIRWRDFTGWCSITGINTHKLFFLKQVDLLTRDDDYFVVVNNDLVCLTVSHLTKCNPIIIWFGDTHTVSHSTKCNPNSKM